jgi:hypothetical protein
VSGLVYREEVILVAGLALDGPGHLGLLWAGKLVHSGTSRTPLTPPPFSLSIGIIHYFR